MNNIILKSCLGLSLLTAVLTPAAAEESLSSLMQRIKAAPSAKVAYQETKHLKLLAEPWQGSGFLYASPPDLMVREQLQPKRLLMGVKGNQYFYFDPDKNSRNQGELDGDSELSLPLAMFKALVTADEALLRSLFHIEFTAKGQDWTMLLTPKQKTGSLAKITVLGQAGQAANKITIAQNDGDSSEFALHKVTDASKSSDGIQKLYQELRGD